MTQLFTNNAASELAANITAAATSMTLKAGDGAKFPNPGAGDDFKLTLFQKSGTSEINHEIVLCTARAGDVITIVRAQEGTTARAYNTGDPVELRQTADAVLPARNGALTGPLNEAPSVTIASAASMNIGTAKANTIIVTGTTTINAFDAAAAGIVRRMTFQGALTLTHGAAALNLLTGANITTAAGDWCEWVSAGAGKWNMASYTRANGDSLGVVSVAKGGTGASTAAAARTALGAAGTDQPVFGTSVEISHASGEVQETLKSGAKYARLFYRSSDEHFGIYTSDGVTTATRIRIVGIGGYIAIAEGAGNVLIGTTTDDGTNKLQVNGAAKATSFVGPLTGNASTATKLATPRAINGVGFDGSADITVQDSTKLPRDGSAAMTGNLNTRTPLWYSTIQEVTSGPVMTPDAQVAKNAVSFSPLLHQRTTIPDYGYRQHLAIGAYRYGTATFGGGIFFAIGDNDAYASKYFLMDDGGNLTWQPSGRRFLHSENYGGYGTFTTNLSTTGRVTAAGAEGFSSATYVINGRSPIWRFGNAEGYGISYFQGTAGYAGVDSIDFHFGTATSAAAKFSVNHNGDARVAGTMRAANYIVKTSDGGEILRSYNTTAEGEPAQFYIAHNYGGVDIGNSRGPVNLLGNATYATNSTRLYASTSPYGYGGSNPYYMAVEYNSGQGRWRLSVYPNTPADVGVHYADNAGLLAGAAPSYSAVGNSIAKRDPNGYLLGSYINMTDDGNPGSNSSAVTAIITKRGDDYYRSTNAAAVKTFLGLNQAWNWSGQSGQPTWLWGSGDGVNMYVWNPSNFSVNFANVAGNTQSVAGATHTGNTWTGMQAIQTNAGSTSWVGNNNNWNLRVQCTDNGGAVMSFLRSGTYGINMGLDYDNIFRIGGFSASGYLFQMDMSGNLTMGGNVTAYSDERLKRNWNPIAPDFIQRWAGVKSGTYERIDSGEIHVGLSAQAVQAVIPEAVKEQSDGYLSLNYGSAAAVATVELAKEVVRLSDQLQMALETIEVLKKKVGM